MYHHTGPKGLSLKLELLEAFLSLEALRNYFG
jgi:hypothetical protein